jgi:hypothetical protein
MTFANDSNLVLHIKPVFFRIDFYGVTEFGNENGTGKNSNKKLCAARVTQLQGAASSMSKVVDTLETVLSSKGYLVQDKRRKREMSRLLR